MSASDRTVLLGHSPARQSELAGSYAASARRWRGELVNLAGAYLQAGDIAAFNEVLDQAGRLTHVLVQRQRALREAGYDQ